MGSAAVIPKIMLFGMTATSRQSLDFCQLSEESDFNLMGHFII